MTEITKEDKSIFLQTKLEVLCDNLRHSENVIMYLGVIAVFLNLVFGYLIFHSESATSVLMNLGVAAFINLVLWLNIGRYLQINKDTLEEVILFENTYSSIRPHYCLQKLEDEFGYTDFRVFLKNIPLIMSVIYALSIFLVADYNGYSMLSVISLGALS